MLRSFNIQSGEETAREYTEQEIAQNTAAQKQAEETAKKEKIRIRLISIDSESVRPARAIAMALAAGSAAPSFDTAKLQALETEAQALRQELAGLQ